MTAIVAGLEKARGWAQWPSFSLFAVLTGDEWEQSSAILTRLTEAMRAGEERC